MVLGWSRNLGLWSLVIVVLLGRDRALRSWLRSWVVILSLIIVAESKTIESYSLRLWS